MRNGGYLMTELWKSIKGYEGIYEVSNLGNVRNIKPRYKYINPNGLLKPVKLNTGYLNVSLINKDKIRKEHRVHRLVAEAFIPNTDNKPQVNHIDSNRANNNVENLEWVTCKENIVHAQKQGRLFDAQQKGGKASHINKNKVILKEAENYIGKTFNNWTIIGIEGFIDNNLRVLVRCTCGNITSLKLTYVIHRTGTTCSKCKGIAIRNTISRNKIKI